MYPAALKASARVKAELSLRPFSTPSRSFRTAGWSRIPVVTRAPVSPDADVATSKFSSRQVEKSCKV